MGCLGVEINKADQDALIFKHMGFVYYIAKGFLTSWQVSYGDHVNSGVVGLIDAIKKYEEKEGVIFKTYAEYRIRGAIQDNLREVHIKNRTDIKKKIKIEPVEFIEDVHVYATRNYQPEDFFIKKENKDILIGLIERLNPKDKFIIKSFIKDIKMEKIGEMLEVSEGRVSQKITEIKGKLKKQFKLSCLRNEIT